jgi:hypothetical protein
MGRLPVLPATQIVGLEASADVLLCSGDRVVSLQIDVLIFSGSTESDPIVA